MQPVGKRRSGHAGTADSDPHGELYARTHCHAVSSRSRSYVCNSPLILVELRALESSIAQLIEAVKVDCGGGPGAECVVLERFSQAG